MQLDRTNAYPLDTFNFPVGAHLAVRRASSMAPIAQNDPFWGQKCSFGLKCIGAVLYADLQYEMVWMVLHEIALYYIILQGIA